MPELVNPALFPSHDQEARWRQHLASRRTQRNRAGFTNSGITYKPIVNEDGVIAEMHLSPCAQHYFTALQAPFHLHEPACIPDLHAVPSKKISVKTRGIFSTGADGNGYLALCNWCNGSDGSALIASTSALASSSSILPLGTVDTTSFVQTKLPYIEAEFEATSQVPGVQARTVGVGLRIRYIGPELARAGQITAVRHPDNETLVNLTYQQIKQYRTAKTYPNERQWVYVLYRPVRPDEYHFSPNAGTPSDGNNFRWETAFTVEGTTNTSGAPGPASFEWEVIRHVEFIGSIDNVTRTHVDLMGMSHVRNALPI